MELVSIDKIPIISSIIKMALPFALEQLGKSSLSVPFAMAHSLILRRCNHHLVKTQTFGHMPLPSYSYMSVPPVCSSFAQQVGWDLVESWEGNNR